MHNSAKDLLEKLSGGMYPIIAIKQKDNKNVNIKSIFLECYASLLWREILGPRISLSIPIFKNVEITENGLTSTKKTLFGIGSIFLPGFNEMAKIDANRTKDDDHLFPNSTILPQPLQKYDPYKKLCPYWSENREYEFMGLVSINLLAYILRENDLHIRNYGRTIIKLNGKDYDVVGKIDHDYIQRTNDQAIQNKSVDKSQTDNMKFENLHHLNPFSLDFHPNYGRTMRFSPFARTPKWRHVAHKLGGKNHTPRRTVTTIGFRNKMRTYLTKNYANSTLEIAMLLNKLYKFNFNSFLSTMETNYVEKFGSLVDNKDIIKIGGLYVSWKQQIMNTQTNIKNLCDTNDNYKFLVNFISLLEENNPNLIP